MKRPELIYVRDYTIWYEFLIFDPIFTIPENGGIVKVEQRSAKKSYFFSQAPSSRRCLWTSKTAK